MVELANTDEPRQRFVHNDFVHDSPAAWARCEHVAGFFTIADSLASRVAWFLADGLATGEQVIVLATQRHRRTIRRNLAEKGLSGAWIAAAIRLEMLWNQLAQTHSFSLLCGYSMGHFYKGVRQQDIHRQHTHLVADSGEHITLH